MNRILRDWGYLGFAAGLAAIIVVSVMLRSSGSGVASDENSTAPAATVPAPTPRPAHTPTQEEIMLDVRRNADMAGIAEALVAYYREFHAYPSTNGRFQPVCAAVTDAGCALRSLSKALPTSDPTSVAYWYQSDGTAFTLFARGEAQPIPSNCPRILPPALSNGPILCLASKPAGS